MLVEHDEILTKVSKKYGVQKRYIVTFWGVETNFGQYLGSFNVPHALATLAFDGRRSAYFRKELLNALKILEEGPYRTRKHEGVLGWRHGAKPVYAVKLFVLCCRLGWGWQTRYMGHQA
jgi:membrane-bound lytic murein transglycosylase B